MKCNMCAKEISSTSNFCKYCGAPLFSNEITHDNETIDFDGNTGIENNNIISLINENGDELYFEVLDLIAYRGNEYIVLLPQFDDAAEVVILQLEAVNDWEESYIGVDNEYTLNAVFELFKERKKDFFDFID